METLTYLIFEGVNFCEEFELALREHKSDLKPHLRRLHLLVTALHEFIETLKTYSQSTHFTKEVREPILKVVHAVSYSIFYVQHFYNDMDYYTLGIFLGFWGFTLFFISYLGCKNIFSRFQFFKPR